MTLPFLGLGSSGLDLLCLTRSSADSSGSDSDSSSSSSSGGEETQNPPKISLTANPPPGTQNNQDHTQATQESYRADSQNDHSADAKIHHSTDDVAQDDENEDTEVNLLAQKLEADQARKRQGSGLSLENPDEFGGSLGAIDELKQFLTVSAEDASGGPVDPVFVNHDSHSQHATQMDSLVFEAAGIVGIEDELNEPRLDSVCNSTIHSAEGSLVLGNDVEDGELPSSPEAFSEPVEAREVSNDSVVKIGEIYKSSEREKDIETVESKRRKEKRSVQKKSDDDSDVDQDGIRHKKRYKKKMKKSKQCEVAKELNVRTEDCSPLKRQKHKKFKSEERALPSSAPTPSTVLPPPPSPQHFSRPSASAATPESSVTKTVPSALAVTPEIAVNKSPQGPPLSSGVCPVAGQAAEGS